MISLKFQRRLRKMIVKDCIYRFITVPELCKHFMDTFMFQRLRNIRQLGMVYMVYPSAVHTRLEHSLGVMHLSGVVCEVLRENGCDITEREKELVQLAGLYHDVGHMAFSHLLDDILSTNFFRISHEERSVIAVRTVNQELSKLSKEEEDIVCDMILGKNEGKTKPYLFEIVHNDISGLDVDRYDYLQRDAYHTGIPGFQPDYLIKCTRVNSDGHIAFLKKARTEVEELYFARKRMFSNVYRHKTVLSIEKHISKIMKEIGIVDRVMRTIPGKDDNENILPPDYHFGNSVNWWALDDIELLHLLRQSNQFNIMYNRTWDKYVLETQFENCSDIHRDDIGKTMSKVLYV